MQCDNCHERPAAVHLTQIEGSTVTQVHLCEECAAEKGVQTGAQMSKFPLGGLLASVGQGAAAALPPVEDATRCELCGAGLQDFRATGRLGCPHCWETFTPHLRELLRRIHGASQHVGETYLPPAGDTPDEPRRELPRLREQLRRAIDAEQFELAAEIRDRIRGLE